MTDQLLTPSLELRTDLKALEQSINMAIWLAENEHEPRVGDVDCPLLAEKYGINRKSCYTAFVEDKQDGRYGCRFETCYTFHVYSLDDAVRHQRDHHFNHRPFMCVPANGRLW